MQHNLRAFNMDVDAHKNKYAHFTENCVLTLGSHIKTAVLTTLTRSALIYHFTVVLAVNVLHKRHINQLVNL